MTSKLFTETDLSELWRLRETAREEEERARKARHAVEGELFRRFEDVSASRLSLGNEQYIDIMYPVGAWSYSAVGVARLKEFLVGRGLITEEEWSKGVSYTPKVDGNRIRGWRKLGAEVDELIDAARMGRTGRPQLKGPPLAEMGHDTPE